MDFSAGEAIKFISLSLSFFFIIGSYSILRSLKTSIFLGFVGKEYQPYTRIIVIILIVPCLLAYARLVDKVKRHQIVYAVLGIYVLLGLVFTALFAHPTIGIANTTTSPYRVLGWAFEIYMDLYSALVVSTFWGFINSSCTTAFANKSYGFIVAASRVGGMFTTVLALLITDVSMLSTTISIPLLVFIATLFLFGSIVGIWHIMRTVPEDELQSHSQVIEPKEEVVTKKPTKKTGLLEGLRIMLKEPYVLGIFGLVYSMEIISILFDYQWQVLLSIQTGNHIGKMSSFMLFYTFSFQALGFIFAVFGVSRFLSKIGLRACLLIMPIATALLTISFMTMPNLVTIFLALVVLRALNYGFNSPIREILYIPTTKDVQFKSKSWIESFGKSFSKFSGSALTLYSIRISPIDSLKSNSIYSLGFSLIYLFVSFFMGKRYLSTIREKKIVGEDT